MARRSLDAAMRTGGRLARGGGRANHTDVEREGVEAMWQQWQCWRRAGGERIMVAVIRGAGGWRD